MSDVTPELQTPAPFEPIARLLERNLSIHHVYGEPVQRGDRTVIPVARVAYGFGAGGGRAPNRMRRHGTEDTPPDKDSTRDAHGAGGGGGVRMTPVGALEIGQQDTRFIHFNPLMPWLVAGVGGAVAGWLLARLR